MTDEKKKRLVPGDVVFSKNTSNGPFLVISYMISHTPSELDRVMVLDKHNRVFTLYAVEGLTWATTVLSENDQR